MLSCVQWRSPTGSAGDPWREGIEWARDESKQAHVRGRRGRDHADDGMRAPHATAGGCDHDGKTADRHVQNAYAKLGVSTRAAATLLAIPRRKSASVNPVTFTATRLPGETSTCERLSDWSSRTRAERSPGPSRLPSDGCGWEPTRSGTGNAPPLAAARSDWRPSTSCRPPRDLTQDVSTQPVSFFHLSVWVAGRSAVHEPEPGARASAARAHHRSGTGHGTLPHRRRGLPR
jgi:hypothetical protein